MSNARCHPRTSPQACQTPQEQAQFDQQSPEKILVGSQVATQFRMQPKFKARRISPPDLKSPGDPLLLYWAVVTMEDVFSSDSVAVKPGIFILFLVSLQFSGHSKVRVLSPGMGIPQ
jgi:hypothetical protein